VLRCNASPCAGQFPVVANAVLCQYTHVWLHWSDILKQYYGTSKSGLIICVYCTHSKMQMKITLLLWLFDKASCTSKGRAGCCSLPSSDI